MAKRLVRTWHIGANGRTEAFWKEVDGETSIAVQRPSMVENVKCGLCRKEIPPYPLGSPPEDMLEVNVAPARNISYNHGLNQRTYICGDCAQRVLEFLGIEDFDWGKR